MSTLSTEELVEFIKEESEKNEKAIKRTTLVGGVIGLFLFCYLFWLHGAIRGMLNPEDLAAIIYGQVDENLPKIIEQIEDEAERKGPMLAKRVSAQLSTIAPSMRVEGELAVDRIFGYLPVANEEMKNAIEAFAADNKQDIADLVEANGIESFAESLVNQLVDEIAKEFNTEFREESGHDLTYLKTASLEELKAINKRLEDLSKKKSYRMNRSELIQKRLISLLMSALDETLEESLED